MLLLYDHKQVKVGNEALLALYDCRTAKSMVRVHFYGELKVQVCLFSSDIKGTPLYFRTYVWVVGTLCSWSNIVHFLCLMV